MFSQGHQLLVLANLLFSKLLRSFIAVAEYGTILWFSIFVLCSTSVGRFVVLVLCTLTFCFSIVVRLFMGLVSTCTLWGVMVGPCFGSLFRFTDAPLVLVGWVGFPTFIASLVGPGLCLFWLLGRNFWRNGAVFWIMGCLFCILFLRAIHKPFASHHRVFIS